MLRHHGVSLARPTCWCGTRPHLQRQGSGPFKRGGAWSRGKWFRFVCPHYRAGRRAPSHLNEAVDGHGTSVELTHRRPRRDIQGRPKCRGAECGGWLTASGGTRTTLEGSGRYFVCTNIRCDEYRQHRFFLRTPQGWRKVNLPRGPRLKDVGVRRCPTCKKEGTLRSQGLFKATGQYRRRLPRIKCRSCGTIYRLVRPGELEKAPLPGFQLKHPAPPCRHHGAMVRGSNHRREGIGPVYRWSCGHRGCSEFVYLDADGHPVPPPEPAKPDQPLVWRCGMPGCHEARGNQTDGRKRYCTSHSRLSYFQRWKQKKKIRDYSSGNRGIEPVRPALVNRQLTHDAALRAEFGQLLRGELGKLGLTPGGAARKASLPTGTIQNWARGVSRPRNREEFIRLARRVGLKPSLFSNHLAADRAT